ncbi:MAG: glutamate--tRNA ligase [Coriobacteriia bacterium]|nr:glutamate--tRNA ligase [Coriobacteriia bacterium]
MNTDIRVRFAPSPTGFLHIGGARTALYNWAFAQRHQGVFVLRIEDTDKERSLPEHTAQIIQSLRWLGLTWDEGPEAGGASGPYLQSERTTLYQDALERLKDSGRVYPCFCSPDELNSKREAAQAKKSYTGYDRSCRALLETEAQVRIQSGMPHTWRIKLPLERESIEFDDEVFGRIAIPMTQLDDFIVMRTDGTPTYNFVVCVDDITMQISHVIRGDDHLSNTPKQIMVYEALDAPLPVFAHLSMILGSDGKRLSKRHGATSVESYEEEGFLSDALFNYLALLGWSMDGTTTLMNRKDITAHFTLDRISKNPAVFDPEKLAWMNQVYLKEMGASAFVDAWTPYLLADKLLTQAEVAQKRRWLEGIYPLVAERINTLSEINAKSAYLFGGAVINRDDSSVEKCLKNKDSLAVLDTAISLLAEVNTPWSAPAIESILRTIPQQLEQKPKFVFQVVRVAVSGSMVSLPLFESMELLGKELCIQRMQHAQTLCPESEACS